MSWIKVLAGRLPLRQASESVESLIQSETQLEKERDALEENTDEWEAKVLELLSVRERIYRLIDQGETVERTASTIESLMAEESRKAFELGGLPEGSPAWGEKALELEEIQLKIKQMMEREETHERA